MNRRNFVERVALTAGSALAAASSHAGEMAGSAATSARFDVTEKAVAQLQAAMQAGTINAQQLVQLYLARIAALDKAGPKLNSIIELNPEALAIAKALDAERKTKGARGPLHGIPVLIKDNIATADAMQTTAGSLALVGAKPPRDAFLVTQLRNAGP